MVTTRRTYQWTHDMVANENKGFLRFFWWTFHYWLDLHKYGVMSINDNNSCIDDVCLGENAIIRRMNTKRWFHSPCYWNVWVFSFSYWFIFFTICAQTTITRHQQYSLVPSMLVFYYQQRVSIALQHVQAITILQWAIALNWSSSSLSHIITSAPSSLANLSQMIALSS